MWIILDINYKHYYHLGKSQICAGAGDYFRPSKPHSGKLWASYICMCLSLPLSGLYLFLQVQFPLSLTSVRYRHFTLIGWGKYSPGENGKNRAETNMNISDHYCLWERTLRAMLTRLISVTVTNPPIQHPTRRLLSIFRTMLINIMEARLSWRQCCFNIFWKNPWKIWPWTRRENTLIVPQFLWKSH